MKKRQVSIAIYNEYDAELDRRTVEVQDEEDDAIRACLHHLTRPGNWIIRAGDKIVIEYVGDWSR